MKRSLFIAIVVLLMATLFVSCNANKSLEDQLVEVSVTTDSARALSMAAEANNVPVASLYWFYTAEKKDNSFKTGETRDPDTHALVETAVKSEPGLLTEKLGDKFSKGAWEFKFYAYADPADKGVVAKRIYSAETTETLKKNLSLTLTLKAESVAAASLYIQNVTFTSDLLGSVYDSVKLFITVDSEPYGSTAGYDGVIAGTTATFAAQETRLDTDGLPADSYQVEFVVKGYIEGETDPDIIGRYPTSAQIVDGMKYIISGSVDAVDVTSEIGIGEPETPVTSSERVTETLKNNADVTFTSTNNPKAVAEKPTTVTFPAGAAGEGEAILTVTAYNAAAAQGNFQIQGSDNKPIAGLDLSLSTVSEFTDYVTVRTYIGENVANPKVVYVGDANLDQPEFVSYEDGYITFRTTHFSSFYVLEAEAKIGSTLYATVNDAVNAAQAGDPVVLLKDVGLSATVSISKNITIDLNGKNIAAVGTRALWVKAGDVTITGNGTISSAAGGNFQSTSSVIRIGDGTNTVAANLTIGASVIVSSDFCYGITIFGGNVGVDAEGQSLVLNGKILVTGTQPAISGNGNATNSKTVITLNDGAVVSASQDYAIYHPQAGTLTVHGATITGLGGVELKAGSTAVIDEDAIVRATGVASHSKNNDGTSTSGYAIAAVENSGYKGNPVVTISNGSFYGPVAILEDDAVEAGKKASITISGGAFDNPSAFDYLADGASIKLLGNIELNSPVFITKSVTIDGDGNAIISNQSIKTYADVTFKNLTYRYPSNSANNASMVYGGEGTKNLVFDNCIFENPQWEVIQYTSNQQESLVVKNCVFRANDIHGATSDYGNAADQAIRYIHIQTGAVVSDVSIEITNNRFAECDKVYDSICGLYYVEGTIKIGGNTFENWATGDVVEGKTAKLSVHWPENESLKEVAKWTGEIATYTI